MNYRGISGSLASIIGGAAIGTSLMYLFDPRRGRQRRTRLADITGRAARTAGEAISSAAQTVGEQAGQLGRATVSGAKEIGATIAGCTSQLADKLTDSRLCRRLRKRAERAADKASDLGSEISGRMGSLIGNRRSVMQRIGLGTARAKTIAGVSLVAIGAGSYYLFSPTRGHHRREAIKRRFLSGFGALASGIERQSKALWNYVTEVRQSESQESDQRLLNEVREMTARCVMKPDLLNTECRRGRVILSGPVLAREADDLLKNVRKTPGARRVVNRLEVHEDLSGFPAEKLEPVGSEANRI